MKTSDLNVFVPAVNRTLTEAEAEDFGNQVRAIQPTWDVTVDGNAIRVCHPSGDTRTATTTLSVAHLFVPPEGTEVYWREPRTRRKYGIVTQHISDRHIRIRWRNGETSVADNWDWRLVRLPEVPLE